MSDSPRRLAVGPVSARETEGKLDAETGLPIKVHTIQRFATLFSAAPQWRGVADPDTRAPESGRGAAASGSLPGRSGTWSRIPTPPVDSDTTCVFAEGGPLG